MKQGYGFIEFEDHRDADDAINDLDGKSICGRRVQIELAKGDRNDRREGDRYGKGCPFYYYKRLFYLFQAFNV